ncbi:LysR family transcriptional regulator [Leisingera sp. ANG-S3]|uniref:LysR family transcriptional regulator n=1 Tax=Leisingera sp. ANG-S3 TaxID=1577899 RepID=UPI00057C4717|nr:LysR family transcriptional regulator [Leisingera sp. ANG-S3]KIC23375.1 LysR family transcriptional regulator [Leisingera sp. ANG-S3]
MDITDELKAFVATAQTGSFTAAADQLGVSNRLTSKYVAELEARLGVRLLQRTTRRVGLTPAGEGLLARAPAVLEDLDTLLADISEESRGFSGVIRLSAPITFGEAYVSGMVARFAAQNPGLSFDLRLNDSYADLAREGIDLAFRVGTSEMLSLKARKLGALTSVAVASPAYVAEHGAPETLDALAQHSCIIDTNRKAPRRWVFQLGAAEQTVHIDGRFQVNSARAAAELSATGLGIALVPRFALGDLLDSGRLVPLLGGISAPPAPVSAVYLEGRSLPRKLRALIDFAIEDIREAGVL